MSGSQGTAAQSTATQSPAPSSTVPQSAVPSATPQSVTTPTVRATTRRLAFWIAAGAFLIVIALATASLVGSSPDENRLSPASPAPVGAKAVAQVLRANGLTVTNTTTLGATTGAVTDPSHTTVVVYDPEGLLTPAQLGTLNDTSADLVLLDPGFAALTALMPAVAQSGPIDKDLTSDCDLPAAKRATTITGTGVGFRFIGDDTAKKSAELCYGSDDDVYSLIRVTDDERTISALGATDALTNDSVASHDNAALALGLLGENESLVWYLPSAADLPTDDVPTFAELSPGWVIPATWLIALVAIAAAFWRGRRFGPLVVENLPVVVRASETMEGRARLYEKGSARLRALDSLRIGAIQRMAELCGLPRLASVDEIVVAVASATARPLAAVSDLLVDARPGSDRELVRLSDALRELETAVASATRPS